MRHFTLGYIEEKNEFVVCVNSHVLIFYNLSIAEKYVDKYQLHD
jgi:hypothetical protein